MKDNFDIHAWNLKRYLNESKSYLNQLADDLSSKYPNLDFYVSDHTERIDVIGSEQDKFNFGDKFHGKKFGEYEVFHTDDDDRGEIVRIVKSDSISRNFENLDEERKYNQEEELRLDLIAHRKFDCDFKKCTDEQKAEVLKDKDKVGVKETIKMVMENPEGFSKYFPDGKTKGLTSDELSTILTRIAKDIEDDGKKLDESTLCKRGQNYMAARKRAGEKSSAYLSGRAVKVCKGQIKGSDSKKKKDYKNESLEEYIDNGPEEKAFDVEMEKAGNGIASAIEKELKNKKPQELNEALITSAIAGILTGNSLIGFISKLSKLLFKKIGFKKGEDVAGKIQHWAHDNEIAFQKPIKRVLGFFIKDTKTLDIVTKAIYAIVVGSMAANYGVEAVSSLSKSDWFSSSLSALKTLAKSDETIINAYPAIKALI